jgi:hypothetical protein
MGRMYYAPIDAPAVTVSQNLWSLQPAADDPILLHAFEISNLTEAGDAEEEMLEIDLIRHTGTPTAGTGTAVTERPAIQDDTATTAAVLEDLTVDVSSGTAETMIKFGWNVRVPYLWLPPPEGRIQVKDNDIILLDLVTAPADTMDIVGWILYEEV